MHDSPGSVVTQLCSGLQLYSAERRIADCILADVKWASVATSAELAKASHSSEATVTRLCHKLGYANYRKFQLELARDVLEQQETEARKRPPNDPLHQALLDLQNNRQEEVQATIQALNRIQRIASDMLPSQLSAALVVEALYYLLVGNFDLN